jgi:hypothetical protein
MVLLFQWLKRMCFDHAAIGLASGGTLSPCPNAAGRDITTVMLNEAKHLVAHRARCFASFSMTGLVGVTCEDENRHRPYGC